jgi:hypothetical protein
VKKKAEAGEPASSQPCHPESLQSHRALSGPFVRPAYIVRREVDLPISRPLKARCYQAITEIRHDDGLETPFNSPQQFFTLQFLRTCVTLHSGRSRFDEIVSVTNSQLNSLTSLHPLGKEETSPSIAWSCLVIMETWGNNTQGDIRKQHECGRVYIWLLLESRVHGA